MPVIEAELTVTADVPDDVSDNVCVAPVFNVTLPKLRLFAPSVNCGFAVAPVPLKATVAGLPVDELLVIVSWPLADPEAVGVNVSDKDSDWLGFSVAGNVPATTLKAAPLIETVFTVTGAVPEDVSVSVLVADVFVATLPKLRLVALRVSCAVAGN